MEISGKFIEKQSPFDMLIHLGDTEGSEAYFKENGSGKLDIRTDGSTYSVIPEVPSGYTLYSGEPSSRSVTLTLDDTSKTVEFKSAYQRSLLSATGGRPSAGTL